MAKADAAKYEAAKTAIQAADRQLTLAQSDYERAQAEVAKFRERLVALGFDPDADLDAQVFDMKSKVIKAEARLTKDIAKLAEAVDA